MEGFCSKVGEFDDMLLGFVGEVVEGIDWWRVEGVVGTERKVEVLNGDF